MDAKPPTVLSQRLGYLFKHAEMEMANLNREALAPFGIDGRELGVMLLAGHEPPSQQQAAERLGVDRTTMVALIDTLEAKGLVSRHPHPQDRRRNVVGLSRAGRSTLRKATAASDGAERKMLAALDEERARQLRETLRQLVVGVGA